MIPHASAHAPLVQSLPYPSGSAEEHSRVSLAPGGHGELRGVEVLDHRRGVRPSPGLERPGQGSTGRIGSALLRSSRRRGRIWPPGPRSTPLRNGRARRADLDYGYERW